MILKTGLKGRRTISAGLKRFQVSKFIILNVPVLFSEVKNMVYLRCCRGLFPKYWLEPAE